MKEILKKTISLGPEEYQLLFFSKLLGSAIYADGNSKRVGRVTDLVFRLAEPYPDAIGIYVEHGGGYPSEMIPWDKVTRIEDYKVFIHPAEGGNPYPPFVDQKGWLLLDQHLMGRTILDINGRRTEVVNDVQLLYSKGRMILVHVDISFNGFLRKWRLDRLRWGPDQFISWRYAQPLSLEDKAAHDIVALSVTREQALELPGEDLADALEVLSGDEQEAMFLALDSEKAAEVLVEAEPRAKRQLIAHLSDEKARAILDRMTVPQMADLLSDLPHDTATKMMVLLSPDRAGRVQSVMSDPEVLASVLMTHKFLSFTKDAKVGEVLGAVRNSGLQRNSISYCYVVGEENLLLGVVDLRDLVIAAAEKPLEELMVAPVVTAHRDALRPELIDLFGKYHFRLLPVVDDHAHLVGIVRYKDIMRTVKIEFKA